jgi:hypothetical protein
MAPLVPPIPWIGEVFGWPPIAIDLTPPLIRINSLKRVQVDAQ